MFSPHYSEMDGNEFHIYKKIQFTSNKSIYLSMDEIPKLTGKGELVDCYRKPFAKLIPFSVEYEGGYGTLIKGERIDCSGMKQTIIIKEPKGILHLGSEALIQWYARKALGVYGLETAIPKVFDIFSKQDMVCFTMEFISGCFPYEYLEKSLSPDITFLQIIAQVAILCWILQKEILLDHRDLKANNIYIRKKPIKYEIQMENKIYHLSCGFQVVLLDFGFACLGSKKRMSKINIAENALSPFDPCPKFGRDMFHLLTSLWSIPSIRDKMTESTRKEIDSWLVYESIDYSKLVRKYNHTDWVYVLTGMPGFSYLALDSLSLLETIHKKFPDVLKTF
jgi:serine/threonine protein kinase